MNNQKGVVHVLSLILLVTGIAVGVYLVQKQQIFKGKAFFGFLSNTVYTFDLREATKQFKLDPNLWQIEIYSPNTSGRYDIEVFVSTLQGIVNRDAPKLYLFNYVTVYPNYDDLGAQTGWGVQNTDKLYFDEARKPGGWLSKANVVPINIPAEGDKAWQGAIRNLLAQFPVSEIIVWDPGEGATLNVATTVAGLADLPVVRFDPSLDSLYTFLTKPVAQGGMGIRVKMNLFGIFSSSSGPRRVLTEDGFVPNTNKKVKSSGSAKNNAYLWAIYRYFDPDSGAPDAKSSADTLAYLEDGYGREEKTMNADCAINRDIAVSRRAFTFDLSPVEEEKPVDEKYDAPPGTDYQTFRTILSLANKRLGNDQGEAKKLIEILGYVPLWDKYNNESSCFQKVSKEGKDYLLPSGCPGDVEQTHGGVGSLSSGGLTEHRTVKLASSYNAYYAHLCDGGTNLSFHQHAPVPEQYPPQNIPPDKNLENKTYITFNYSDVDGPMFLSYMAATWQNAKHRGDIPVSWSLDPQPDLLPQVYNWFYQTKKPTDYFTSSDTIVGWMFPNQLVPPRDPKHESNLPSGLNVWKNQAQNLTKQFNLEISGEFWNGAPMKTEVKNALLAISPKGVAGIFDDGETPTIEVEKEELYQGMPIKNINYSTLGLYGNPQQDAVLILQEAWKSEQPSEKQTKPIFLYFRDVLKGPDYYWGLMNYIRQLQKDPNNGLAKYNFEVVDPYTFFKLYKDFLSGGPTASSTPAPTSSVVPTTPIPTPSLVPTPIPTTSVPTPTPAPSTKGQRASLPEVHPVTASTNATSGTFDVIATGATNADMIWFGAWTLTNQIDDLKWYQGINQGNGRWVGKIDLANHIGIDFIFVRACATNSAFPQIDIEAGTVCKDTSFQRIAP